MRALRVDVWSDIACPWCYVGKRRLEAAIAELPDTRVDVVWRSFELDPDAPRVQPASISYAERLARKYSTTIGEADAMIARMTAVAAADGLTFRFDRIRPGNTFDAHRLLQLAHERAVQETVEERLLRAYMTEGEAIGEPEVLARLGADAGLEPGEVRDVLASARYGAEVRADEQEAYRLGIHSVPFFVLAGKYGISGAQPVDVLHRALATAAASAPEGHVASGPVCGPEGCE